MAENGSPAERAARPALPLGQIVRQLRHERGETLRDLAGRAGLSPVHLSRIERHQCSPTAEIVAGLADALAVPIALLFGRLELPVPGENVQGVELHGRAATAGTAAGSTSASLPEWLRPAIAVWQRLLLKLNDPVLRLDKRRSVAEAAVKQLTEHYLTLDQPRFYEELRRAWQSCARLDERLAAARRLFDRYRPQAPEAALIFPRFRFRFEYRETGTADCWYEFAVANIGDEPVVHYDNQTIGGGRTLTPEEDMGLRITDPDNKPAAEVEWLPAAGDAIRWQARLVRPLQPGECRELVEHWVWHYRPPLAGIRNNSDVFAVHAFIGELEMMVGYPHGYVAELNMAWLRDGDRASSMVDVQLMDADRSVVVFREALPPFDGSDQLAFYSVLSVLRNVVEAEATTSQPDATTRVYEERR